jgi:hypothetical protein
MFNGSNIGKELLHVLPEGDIFFGLKQVPWLAELQELK